MEDAEALENGCLENERIIPEVVKRQSVRAYLDKAVDRAIIEACIEAARLAPSACNSQAWKFIAVDKEGPLEEIRKAAAGQGMNSFVKQVPVLIAAVIEAPNMASRAGGMLKGTAFTSMDMGGAVEHICLQAVREGLGTCILGWFDQKRVKSVLGIPKSKKVPLLIAIGYPADEKLRKKSRKTMESIFQWNSCGS